MDLELVRRMNEYVSCIVFYTAPFWPCRASRCLACSSVTCASLRTYCLNGDSILLRKQAAARMRSTNQLDMNFSLLGKIGEVKFGGHGVHFLDALS